MDYCTDPEANVNGTLTLGDALTPCPQLMTTVPILVAVQLVLFVTVAHLRRRAMVFMGLDPADIDAIFSSRRAGISVDASVADDDDIEAVKNGETVSLSDGSTGKSHSSGSSLEGEKEEGKGAIRHSHTTTKTTIISSNSSTSGSEGIIEASDDVTEQNKDRDNEDGNSFTPPTVEVDLDLDIQTDNATSNTKVVFDLPTLMEKYGDKKLRVLDSLPRKTVHFLVLLMSSLALEFTTDTFVAQGQTACLSALTSSCLLWVAYTCAPEAVITSRLYGWAARIRDGKVARKNLLVAYCAAFSGIFATYLIGSQGILQHLQDPTLQKLMLVLYYAPLAVGDAMGELIGSPFGGTFFNTFRVQGFGEINRKSVEGCFAVFVGSLVSTIVVCLYYGAITSSWMVLCLLMSIMTTIVETASFRSTDNFFIPLFNCVVVLLALGPFGDKFSQV